MNRDGYTLLEMLVGVAILVVTVLVVAQRHRGDAEIGGVVSAGAPVVQALDAASSGARAGVPHRFCFERGSHRFWVEAREPGSERYVPITTPERVSGVITVEIEAAQTTARKDRRLHLGGAMRGATIETFDFRPDGSADGGRFLFTDRKGHGLEIRILPDTGRLQVVEM